MVCPAQLPVASPVIFTPQWFEWTTFPLLYNNLAYYMIIVHRRFIAFGREACAAIST